MVRSKPGPRCCAGLLPPLRKPRVGGGGICLSPQGCVDSLFPAHQLQKASEQSPWVGRGLGGHLALWFQVLPDAQVLREDSSPGARGTRSSWNASGALGRETNVGLWKRTGS